MYAFFLILLPLAFAQYAIDTGMKPDVRFDERNERYDIGPLMDPGDYVEQENFRRQGAMRPQSAKPDQTLNTKVILELIDKIKQRESTPTSNTLLSHLEQLVHQTRRAGNEGKAKKPGYQVKQMHDQMNYARGLDRFMARNTRRSLVDYLLDGISRRSGLDPEKEVLLHHAVPVVMNVQGFLKMPAGSQ